MSSPTRLATVLLTAATLLLAAACGTYEDHGGRYSSLLRLVPDDPAFRDGVTIVDYGAIRALPGYEAAQPPAQGDEDLDADLDALRDALEVNGVAVPFGEIFGTQWDSLPANLANWEQSFGFGLPDIDRAMTAGIVPPKYLHAIGGEFDPAIIEAQLQDCADCIEGVQGNYQGQRYFGWGEGQTLPDRLRLPAFDDLGRGGNFVFDSNYVLRSNFVEEFEAAIDASQGRSAVLGDEDFSLLADELDSMDLLVLFVSDRTLGPDYALQLLERVGGDPMFVERVITAWDVPPEEKLATYSTFAVGAGVSDNEPFTVILLVHESDETASANVQRLEARIETGITASTGGTWASLIDSAEVATQGRLLVATLRGGSYYGGLVNNPGLGSITVEALLAHE